MDSRLRGNDVSSEFFKVNSQTPLVKFEEDTGIRTSIIEPPGRKIHGHNGSFLKTPHSS